MNVQTSKNLGIIGVLIIFLDAILSVALPFATRLSSLSEGSISTYGIIRTIGIIVVLISIYHLANFYQTKTIYTNARNGVIAAIIGTILPIPIGIMFSPFSGITLLLYLAVLTIFFTVAAIYVRRSLNELSVCSGIDDFASAGKWMFIGAILTIIIFGLIIIGIAFLILLNAFSKLKNPELTLPSTLDSSTMPQTTSTKTNTQIKAYCPYCGNPILPENVFCSHCGQHI
jgi:uncharacterized membrane protein